VNTEEPIAASSKTEQQFIACWYNRNKSPDPLQQCSYASFCRWWLYHYYISSGIFWQAISCSCSLTLQR